MLSPIYTSSTSSLGFVSGCNIPKPGRRIGLGTEFGARIAEYSAGPEAHSAAAQPFPESPTPWLFVYCIISYWRLFDLLDHVGILKLKRHPKRNNSAGPTMMLTLLSSDMSLHAQHFCCAPVPEPSLCRLQEGLRVCWLDQRGIFPREVPECP
jgi:hypothetical protein